MAGALRRRRHHLDGRRRRTRPRRVLHPVALLGVRLGLRAAGDRRADAEPRRELLARSQGAECARARPAAVPHAQSGARRAQRRPRHGLRHHGRRRPAADAGRCVHAPRAVRPAARQGDRRAALAARPHLGLDAHQSADGIALRRQSDRSADVRRPRRRGAAARPIPTPWATPARWCCIPTARSKARTIRAPTAARLAYRMHGRAGPCGGNVPPVTREGKS